MKEKKSTILVTGGAGYIGSHVISLLGEAGFNIVVVDNLSTGFKNSVLFGELKIIDLSDEARMTELFRDYNFDAVIHFAGSIVVPESVADPLKYYLNNTINSAKLINLCKKFSVKKFIFSSTAAVYGIPSTEWVDENSPTEPINPYGTSKLMTELMLRDYSLSSDFSYVALRYFNVAGADLKGRIGQSFPKATHLIKVCAEAALKKRSHVSIFGTDYKTPDKTGIRDYIHVLDLAQAHLDALEYLQKSQISSVLNCGYGEGHSVREVINVMKKVSGVDFKVIEEKPRAGDPPKLVAKAEKIKSVLNWKPKYNDLELIVKSALDWEKKLGQSTIS